MANNNIKSRNSNTKIKKRGLVMTENKNSIILPMIISFCFPVILYIQTLNFGFIYFDEDGILMNNIDFLKDTKHIFHAFLTDAFIGKSLFYRPLQTISYMIDIMLSGGNNPWMYHLSNVLLTGTIAVALFLLITRFKIRTNLALLTALIFCSHPLFISFIAWIPSRGDLLLTLFSLLSFIFFIDFVQKKKICCLLLCWAAFTLALFSKETAAVLPFLFLWYYFAFSTEKQNYKKILPLIILFVFSGALWFYLRSKAISPLVNSKEFDLVGFMPLISNLRTIPESLVKFFLLMDIVPLPFFSIFKTLSGIVIMAIIIFLLFRNKERKLPEKIFCLTWFIVLMLPPMLYKHKLIDYLDHRFFLPLIGILFFLLFIIPRNWFKNDNFKEYWMIIIVIIFLSLVTLIKCRNYSSPETFYDSAISSNPKSAFAYNNRGNVKIMNRDYTGALADCKEAASISPTFAQAFYNIGVSKANLGDDAGAIEAYNQAIQINPGFDQFYYNRAYSKTNTGDYSGAKEDYNKAIRINPGYFQAYYNLGIVKVLTGDYNAAIADYEKAAGINHKYFKAFFNIAIAKSNMGDIKGALEAYNKTILVNPRYDEAYCNKGVLEARLGMNEAAMEDCNKALEINPGYYQVYYNRGLLRANLGDKTGAMTDYDKAIETNSNYDQAYFSRGALKAGMGDDRGAIEDFNRAISIDPNYYQAYQNRAISYFNLKDFPALLKDCEEMLRLNPGDKYALSLKSRITGQPGK